MPSIRDWYSFDEVGVIHFVVVVVVVGVVVVVVVVVVSPRRTFYTSAGSLLINRPCWASSSTGTLWPRSGCAPNTGGRCWTAPRTSGSTPLRIAHGSAVPGGRTSRSARSGNGAGLELFSAAVSCN